MTRIDVRQSVNTERKHRWAVWIDARKPTIVSSRSKAKRLCAKAKVIGYFCRWRAEMIPAERRATLRISDFIIWRRGSDGRFARHMYLLPEDMLSGLTVQPFGFAIDTADHERYRRALANADVWKLGPECLLKSFGHYPSKLLEVTLDSDEGMLCAGYRCIGEASSMAELHTAFGQLDSHTTCCGTLDDNRLKIWVNVIED